MAKGRPGRPAGVNNERGLYTVAIPKELYDQVDELAIGSGMTRTAVATFLMTQGLAGARIIEETYTRKRLDFD